MLSFNAYSLLMVLTSSVQLPPSTHPLQAALTSGLRTDPQLKAAAERIVADATEVGARAWHLTGFGWGTQQHRLLAGAAGGGLTCVPALTPSCAPLALDSDFITHRPVCPRAAGAV